MARDAAGAEGLEAVRDAAAPGDRVAALEDHERPVGGRGLEVVGGADAGDPGADDQDVEVFGLGVRPAFERGAGLAHGALLYLYSVFIYTYKYELNYRYYEIQF